MEILGVDPSLTMTGLACTHDGIVATRRIPTLATAFRAQGLLSTRDRIRYIVGQTLRFAPLECLTVIEAPYVPQGGKAAGSVIERAWLFGLLVDQLTLRGPVVQVPARTRAKYATGNGNADKKVVLAAMRAAYPGVSIPDDNVADALALLGMGARSMGVPIDGVLELQQLSAMDAVRWPDNKEMKK